MQYRVLHARDSIQMILRFVNWEGPLSNDKKVFMQKITYLQYVLFFVFPPATPPRGICYLFLSQNIYQVKKKSQIFIHLVVIDASKSQNFYPFYIIHILKYFQKVSIWLYPFEKWIKFTQPKLEVKQNILLFPCQNKNTSHKKYNGRGIVDSYYLF